MSDESNLQVDLPKDSNVAPNPHVALSADPDDYNYFMSLGKLLLFAVILIGLELWVFDYYPVPFSSDDTVVVYRAERLEPDPFEMVKILDAEFIPEPDEEESPPGPPPPTELTVVSSL